MQFWTTSSFHLSDQYSALPARADTVTVDGLQRTFTVPCPRAVCRPNLAVILAFQGGIHQPSSFVANAGAIMVYPRGPPALQPTWSTGTESPSTWAERSHSDNLCFAEPI